MIEVTYSLKNNARVPDRFRDQEVKYNLPETVDEIRSLIPEGVNEDKVLVHFFNGQGYRLDVQKRLVDVLEAGKIGDAELSSDVAEALGAALAEATQVKEPGATRAGGGKKAALARAEAKAEAAHSAVTDLYRTLNKSQRKQVRATQTNPEVVALFDAIDGEEDAS